MVCIRRFPASEVEYETRPRTLVEAAMWSDLKAMIQQNTLRPGSVESNNLYGLWANFLFRRHCGTRHMDDFMNIWEVDITEHMEKCVRAMDTGQKLWDVLHDKATDDFRTALQDKVYDPTRFAEWEMIYNENH